MNAGLVLPTQRRLIALLFAATLALTASFGPMALDHLMGTHLTETAAACHGSGSGGC